MRIPVHGRVKKPRFFRSLDRILNCLFSNVCCNEESLGHSKKQKADLSCIESESAKSTNSPKNLWFQNSSKDFKTPQKKSTKMVFDGNSNISNKQIHARQEEAWILNTSNLLLLQNLYLVPISKHIDVYPVDWRILSR